MPDPLSESFAVAEIRRAMRDQATDTFVNLNRTDVRFLLDRAAGRDEWRAKTAASASDLSKALRRLAESVEGPLRADAALRSGLRHRVKEWRARCEQVGDGCGVYTGCADEIEELLDEEVDAYCAELREREEV